MRTKNMFSSASYFISSKESSLRCCKDGMVSSLISQNKIQNLLGGDNQKTDPTSKNLRLWGCKSQCANLLFFFFFANLLFTSFCLQPHPSLFQKKQRTPPHTKKNQSAYSKHTQEMELWKLSTPEYYLLTVASPFRVR